jgi:hypothetical protein
MATTFNKDGYLYDLETGRRAVHYECDPAKNHYCDKKGCTENTYCTTTLNINFKKDGTKPFYIKAVRGDKVKFERVPVTQEA